MGVFKKTDCWNKKFCVVLKKFSTWCGHPPPQPAWWSSSPWSHRGRRVAHFPSFPSSCWLPAGPGSWEAWTSCRGFSWSPEILNGIHVAALARPVPKSDVLSCEPGHHPPWLVAGSSILLEDGGPSLGHGLMQVPGENCLVEVGVHPGQDVEPAQLPISKAALTTAECQ